MASPSTGALTRLVLREIEKLGILLVTDPSLPSVTRLVTGEAVRGSWWGHPKGRLIFAVLSKLEDEPSLLLVKLIEKKQTLVHRSLWPELLAIAGAKEDWQTRGLPSAAKSLLERVESAGALRLDEIPKTLAKSARTLEERLLVHSSQVHTETGAHQKILTSWEQIAKERSSPPPPSDVAGARAAFESRTSGKLPWQTSRTSKHARRTR